MDRLKGKVALITGATGGIGEASAKLFASEGAKLALLDLDQPKLNELTQQIGSETALGLRTDVTDADAMTAAVKETCNKFGRLDVAFLNAGVEGPIKSIVDYPNEDFDTVMSVNVKGVFNGLKSVVPAMIENNGGSIILTSSLGGLRGMQKLSAYIASKHAVVGLMKSATLEYAENNIRVNTINPSPIATRMIKSIEDGYAPGASDVVKRKIEKGVPLRRYGRPVEVANLALFLASDDASFITGNSYPVDGGMSAS